MRSPQPFESQVGQCDAAGNGSRPNLCSFEKPVIEVVSRSSSFYREPFRCLLGQIREVITGLRFDDVCLRDGLPSSSQAYSA